MTGDVVLEGRSLTKRFGQFTAVSSLDIAVRAGSIHALIGPNGAGKTTSFNLLTKQLRPTEGTIWLNGQDVTRLGPKDVARRGLARSFQISSVFPELTALENVRVALQRERGESIDFWRSDRVLRVFDKRAMALLEEVGLADLAHRPAAELAYGRKRALELATTLALDPKIMLLDEPTAGMGHEDVHSIIALIRRFSAGRTILLVEHNLDVLQGLCDVITVMARGKVMAHGTYAEISASPEVIEAYLGDA